MAALGETKGYFRVLRLVAVPSTMRSRQRPEPEAFVAPILMQTQNEQILTTITIGESKTVVLVSQIRGSRLRYRGHGTADSRGFCDGRIVALEQCVSTVGEALDEAERTARVALERAVVGVAGPHIYTCNLKGRLSLGLHPREVAHEDVRRAVKTVPLPKDHTILHMFCQTFIIDQQKGIGDPIGIVGRELEVHAHVVISATTAVRNIVTVLNRAGIYVEDTVYEPLASSRMVLRTDERERGVCVCDVGVSSMDILVLYKGVVVHSSSILTGVRNVRNCSGALTYLTGGSGTGQKPQREAQESRAEELIEMLRDNLQQAGVLEMLGAGVVFVGCGVSLPGFINKAEAALCCPTRLGLPLSILNMPDLLCQQEFDTAIGVALYRARALEFQQWR